MIVTLPKIHPGLMGLRHDLGRNRRGYQARPCPAAKGYRNRAVANARLGKTTSLKLLKLRDDGKRSICSEVQSWQMIAVPISQVTNVRLNCTSRI